MRRYLITLLACLCLLSMRAQTRHYTAHDGLLTNDIWQIVELPNGQLLVNVEGAFELFNGKEFVPVACDVARCYRMEQFGGYAQWWQGDSLLWLRDYYNVYLFDARRLSFRYDFEKRATAAKEFAAGRCGERSKPDGRYAAMLKASGMEVEPDVTAACRDRQGGTWLGTLGQGLYYLPPAHPMATTFHTPSGKGVAAMALCPDGLIVGTEDGILCFDPRARIYKYVCRMQGASFRHATSDKQGRVWLSASVGLYCYDHGALTLYGSDNVKGFVHSWVRFALPLSKDVLLVANHLHYLGLLHLDTKEFAPLNGKLPQLDGYRTMVEGCLLADKRRVAILTQNGIVGLDSHTLQLAKLDSLPGDVSQKYNCAYVDSRQRLWLGTQGGLAEGGRVWLRACVKGIAEDAAGNLWVATAKGLTCLVRQGGAMKTIDFTASDGIPEEGITERGLLADGEDGIWLASSQGLTLFRPKEFMGEKAAGRVTLVGFTVNGGARALGGEGLSIAYDENNISLSFSALNYATPHLTSYRYRLEGLDAQWHHASGNEGMCVARYNALPSGDYVFEVQCSVGNGPWSPVCRKSFTVCPPLWLTWWAKTVYVLLSVALVAGLLFVYLKRKREKMERENDARVNRLFELREEARHQFAQNVNVQPGKIGVNKEEEELVGRLMEAIGQHLDDGDYTVDLLAADVCMSRTGLYRKMQAMLGITPNDFVRNVRLKRAARLLDETDLPVNQVALMVGFKTPRYFSQYFKGMFGVTPSEYRAAKSQ